MKQLHQQPSIAYRLRGKTRKQYGTIRLSFLLFAFCFLLFITPGCKKFIEVPLPGTETFPDAVFSSDVNATGAVVGIYGNMVSHNGFASGNTRSVTFLSALSADELENYSALIVPREFYENDINTNNTAIDKALWDEAYEHIYAANAVLEGLNKFTGVTPATKERLRGEARFIRAFCHFYLVNLLGDVPYIDTTDYQTNIIMFRTPRATVYQRIITDLKDAQSRLSDAYVDIERVRPNKWAATALLARAYLYTSNWVEAEMQASAVIDQTGMYSLDSLNGVFLMNSREAIWQLKPNPSTGYNTQEGKNFILTLAPATGENNSTVLSHHLLQAFESGDQRRASWVDSIMVGDKVYYFPYKYKIQNGKDLKEYSMVLRLAEQYLVRAEARAQRGNIAGARADVDTVRKRAGLPGTTANSSTALLAAIAQERQVELFTEWGHRWLDLKRTHQANTVLSAAKAPGWLATDTLYPIPQNERSLNRNLTQNPGYN